MLAFLFMIIGCGGGGGGGGSSSDPEPDVPLTDVELTKQAVLATGSFTEASLSNAIVGPAGGTVAVTSGPLTGVKLIVPAGATTEDITFEISSSSLTSLSGLAKGIVPGDRVIRIKATGSELWNEYMFFDKPVTVTLPYSGFDPEFDETSIRFYSYDHASSSFEAAGFLSMDTDKNEITFETRSFANILPENILQADSLQLADAAPAVDTTFSDYASLGFDALEFSDWLGGATLDTGFLPSKHGFYIPNYGSFYHGSTGGACKGMSVFAKYYYQKGYTPLLYSNYKDDAPTSTWLDDATAIQLGSRVQDKYDWAGNTSEKNEQDHSWYTMRSILGAFLVTGKPTMISLYKQSNTGASLPGAHATLAYKAVITSSEITFFIYPPPISPTTISPYLNSGRLPPLYTRNSVSPTTLTVTRFGFSSGNLAYGLIINSSLSSGSQIWLSSSHPFKVNKNTTTIASETITLLTNLNTDIRSDIMPPHFFSNWDRFIFIV